MRISDLLRNKGADVVTITPDSDVRQLLTLLREHKIGAVVVSHDGSAVDGIVSERDVVRALADEGASLLSEHVHAIMTVQVHTVTPDAKVDDLMLLMTEHRIRHVPVVTDDALTGLVSIGDVVKSRILELESEKAALNDYIGTAR